MARTDADRVSAILAEDPDVGTLDIHIEDANDEVNESLPTSDISSSKLERIERYLAAHSYKFLQDRQLEEFSRESSGGTFTGLFGEGLKGTSYGQMAIETDPTGVLAQRIKPTATVRTLDSRNLGRDRR